MAWTDPRTWTDGELVTAAIMNPHVRDNLNALGPHLIVRKTSDQLVTSSTALVDDTALVLPVAGTEVWKFEFCILFAAATAGAFKYGFTFPASGVFAATAATLTTAAAATVHQFADSASPTQSESAGNAADGAGTLATPLIVQGVYVNGGTGGNVTLQWAQNASNATSTRVKANSTLWAVRLA